MQGKGKEEIVLQHTSFLRVRYAETDKMGVVYNGEYLTFFEVGRTEALREFGLPYPELEKEGYLLPVIEAFVRYKSPAYYDDVLGITAFITTKNEAILKIEYKIHREDVLVAEGYTAHSFVHAHNLKPARPPKSYRNAIEQYVTNFYDKKVEDDIV